MKLLFDFFPIILFFVAFKIGGIYVATGVAIAATFAQIGWVWFKGRRVEPMLWVSLVIVVLFGGATLLLHNDPFIKWKPTVLYWVFAAALVGGQVLFRKNLIQSLLGSQMQLPGAAWTRLNWSAASGSEDRSGCHIIASRRYARRTSSGVAASLIARTA